MSGTLDEFTGAAPDAPVAIHAPAKAARGPFDYINDITMGKKWLALADEESTGEFPREYSPYLTDMALGQFQDTVQVANEASIRMRYLSPRVHYMFHMRAVPKKKRWTQWPKKDIKRAEAVQAAAKYYGWSERLAASQLYMLSPEDIAEIIAYVNSEGIQRKGKEK